jgi:hypothetical protein
MMVFLSLIIALAAVMCMLESELGFEANNSLAASIGNTDSIDICQDSGSSAQVAKMRLKNLKSIDTNKFNIRTQHRSIENKNKITFKQMIRKSINHIWITTCYIIKNIHYRGGSLNDNRKS